MFLICVTWFPASAESVDVKYRGSVDLKAFECPTIKDSSFVKRVCYDKINQYMIVQLQRTYYHYCEIGPQVVAAFIAADSLGRFYNATIKGSGADGPYDCRTHRVPTY
jgi:hypothetical protein